MEDDQEEQSNPEVRIQSSHHPVKAVIFYSNILALHSMLDNFNTRPRAYIVDESFSTVPALISS